MCKLCLNCRLLLDVLVAKGKKDDDEVTSSVSEVFMHYSTCQKVDNGYYSLKCVTGKCQDCKLLKPLQLTCAGSAEIVQVRQLKLHIPKLILKLVKQLKKYRSGMMSGQNGETNKW